MIALLAPGTRQPAAQLAALTVALAALAAAVADLRAAQQRLHQAEAARRPARTSADRGGRLTPFDLHGLPAATTRLTPKRRVAG